VSAGGTDIFISKLSASGNFSFAHRIGGTSSDEGIGIALDGEGNVYLASRFAGTVDFDPGAGVTLIASTGNTDVAVTKLSNSGSFVYARGMGGTGNDLVFGLAVAADGSVTTTGYFSGTADFDPSAAVHPLVSRGGLDVFVSQLDASGNFAGAFSVGSPPSSGHEAAWATATDADGNFYIAGEFTGAVDFGTNGEAAYLLAAGSTPQGFVAKYSPLGHLIWVRGFLGQIASVRGIAVDDEENVYTTGIFEGTVDFDPGSGEELLASAGGLDVFVSKLDAAGNHQFAVRIGSTHADNAHGIALDADRNIYIAGSFQGTVDFDPSEEVENRTSAGGEDGFVLKLDSQGLYQYAATMGGATNDVARAIAVDSQGNAYVTGNFTGTADFEPGPGIHNLVSAGGDDIFVVKLNAAGNLAYAQRFGDNLSQIGRGIAVDESGNAYVIGAFRGTVDFDPGAGTVNLSSAGSDDIFILKLTAAGDYGFAARFGSTGVDIGYDIAVDDQGRVYATGSFSGTVDFDPGAGVAPLTSAGGGDVFVVILNDSGDYVNAVAMGGMSDEHGFGIAIDSFRHVIVSGWFAATADFDPGPGVQQLSSVGGQDWFVVKLLNAPPQTPVVTHAETDEDTQSTGGLTIVRNPANGSEVTHFKVTNVQHGTLYLADGTTVVPPGSFIDINQASAGLRFTPSPDFHGMASFLAWASLSSSDQGIGSDPATVFITVNPVADTPLATGTTTDEDTQSLDGLVLERNPVDGAEVSHFKITDIVGGTLYHQNGVTSIPEGSFITVAVGNMGLRFTPSPNLNSANSSFGFKVQASLSASDAGLGGEPAVVTILVNPVNDDATITGDDAGSVFEDGQLTASGTLTVHDVDEGEDRFANPASLLGEYGAFTFDPISGEWTYTLDNGLSVVQALRAGEQLTDRLTVHSFDGTASREIVITITGANDLASIQGVAEGTVQEDGLLAAGGTLSVSDVDTGEDRFAVPPAGSLNGLYGTFTFDALTGQWSYALDNASPLVQALAEGAEVFDTLTVTSFDGTATREIIVTIEGANDLAAISGNSTGVVVEDDVLTTGGTLSVSDIDSGENRFAAPAQASLNGVYGTFTFNPISGEWAYSLNNSLPAVQALSQGEEATDGLTVTSLDGTASRQVVVTIVGSNEAPVLDPTVMPSLRSIEEDFFNAWGTPIWRLLDGVRDIDYDGRKGVAITGLQGTTSGQWQYTLDGGQTWHTIANAHLSSALLIPAAGNDTRIRFVPKPNFHGEVAVRFIAWDQTTGLADERVDLSLPGSTGGSSAFSVAEGTATLIVEPVNDAPVIDRNIVPPLRSIAEDNTRSWGTPVWMLCLGISDVDQPSKRGLAITAAGAGNGRWEYTLDEGVSWHALGSVSSSSALLLPSNGNHSRVRFIPNKDWNGTVGLGYFAWDQTEGSAGQRVDVSSTKSRGGRTAFSYTFRLSTLTVTPVNDPPEIGGISGPIGYKLNAAPILLAPHGTVRDIDSLHFNGGYLRIAVVEGHDSGNGIIIRGAFSLVKTESATQIVVDGVSIGTLFNDGLGLRHLRVNFNENATKDRVQRLLRSIMFRTKDSLNASDRLVSITLHDGVPGGLSQPATRRIQVSR
jgi:VCBS repeat-containing protein